jgi:carboxyl-terminal processing protease
MVVGDKRLKPELESTHSHMARRRSRLRRLWRGTLLTGFVLVSASCMSTPGPSAEPAAAGPTLDERVFIVGFERIDEVFVDPVDIRVMAVDGLNGLSAIDPNIKATLSDGMVQLYSGERQVLALPAPARHDARGWGHLISRMAGYAAAWSPPLRGTTADAIYSAILGHVVHDLDEYSRYSDPDHARVERADRDGYGGLGISLSQQGEWPTIVDIYSGSSAERSGLAVGERITSIDGVPTRRLSEDDAMDMMHGPLNSVVTLGIEDGNGGAVRTVSVTRERVVRNSVTARFDDGVGILTIDRFNTATAANLARAIYEMRAYEARLKGFVLDLRGNPGGLLDQAIASADLFMDSGLISEARGRHPDSMQRYIAHPGDQAHNLPLVVLIDGGTASAAEVMAAALRDSERAVLVGTVSYGKGSVQTVTRLPNQAELFLTWSRLYSPSGATLNRLGVYPTICTTALQEGDVGQVLARLRINSLPTVTGILALQAAAATDVDALADYRRSCPPSRTKHAVDLDLALGVADNSLLFQRAIALQTRGETASAVAEGFATPAQH